MSKESDSFKGNTPADPNSNRSKKREAVLNSANERGSIELGSSSNRTILSGLSGRMTSTYGIDTKKFGEQPDISG
jgi:hypothetical protein